MKVGLVLAGGGAKGAYQIGALKAIRALKIERYIQVVSGTSIGALNAMLFLQGDLEKAEELWVNISKEKILPSDTKDLVARGILITLGAKNINFVKKYMPKALEAGNISRSGLLDIMNEYLDLNKVLDSGKICYATCTEIPDLVPKYFKINEYNIETIKSILLATSALPMIYDSEEVESNKYLDGGMVDNTPIQPVYGENCDIIIVIHLIKEANINRSLYPNTKFIDIIPKSMEESGVDGILDFTTDRIVKRIKQGYEDTLNYLEPIFELSFNLFNDNINLKGEVVEEYEKKSKKIFFNLLKEKLIKKGFDEKKKDI